MKGNPVEPPEGDIVYVLQKALRPSRPVRPPLTRAAPDRMVLP